MPPETHLPLKEASGAAPLMIRSMRALIDSEGNAAAHMAAAPVAKGAAADVPDMF